MKDLTRTRTMKAVVLSAILSLLLIQVRAQNVDVPQIGARAPSFTAMSTEGTLSFPDDFGNSWKILFAHPRDFTPVCSAELLELAHAQDDFEQLGAELVVVSTDIMTQHRSWKAALEEVDYKGKGTVDIEFPIVSDSNYTVAYEYGMIHDVSSVSENIRGVYFIDPDNEIRSIQFYPNRVGRSMNELKRTLMALKKTRSDTNVATPPDWESGDDVLVRSFSKDERKNLDDPEASVYRDSWFLNYQRAE